MVNEAEFDQVIGSLYDAAAEPELWPAALIATADLLGGVGAQFFLWDKLQGAAPLPSLAAYLTKVIRCTPATMVPLIHAGKPRSVCRSAE